MTPLFGTDGIRGTFGQAPMDETTVRRLACVIGAGLNSDATVVIGRDSRQSGPLIARFLQDHLGCQVIDLGVVTTPIVAWETSERAADLGIMITASHNPPADNGLKFFASNGYKIDPELAARWSEQLSQVQSVRSNQADHCVATPDHYLALVKQQFGQDCWGGLKVVFDLAHGGAAGWVKTACDGLGLDAVWVADSADGEKINMGVGAMAPGRLAQAVLHHEADVGFAFDGDGDRLVVVDREGRVVSGDAVLFALANCYRLEKKHLKRVVGTVLCGQGLSEALNALDLKLVRTAVGDQHILRELRRSGELLGGEPSGHIIQMDLLGAGDGLFAALRLLRHLVTDKNLLQASQEQIPSYPTLEHNLRVRHKPDISSVPELQLKCEEIERLLAGQGRWILRYSGTEPLLRIFVEAKNLSAVEGPVNAFARKAEEVLNHG